MIAGVGKTYRMLQEARELLAAGADVKIAYIEALGRPETEAMSVGVPALPRRKLFYKGKELGGTVIRKKSDDVQGAIIEACAENKVSCVLAAKPEIGFFSLFVFGFRVKSFMEKLAKFNIDLSILS